MTFEVYLTPTEYVRPPTKTVTILASMVITLYIRIPNSNMFPTVQRGSVQSVTGVGVTMSRKRRDEVTNRLRRRKLVKELFDGRHDLRRRRSLLLNR